MKVIFETPFIENVDEILPDGRRYLGGKVKFRAILYAPGETPPKGAIAVAVEEWRRRSLQPDGSLRINPPQSMSATSEIPAAVIPAPLIAALPDDHLLTVSWFHSGGSS